MVLKLVERDKAKSRVNIPAMISLLASLILVCIVIPAVVFWFGSGNVELVQKSILAGTAIAAVVFGVIFGRALSPARRPIRFRRRQHLN